MPYNNDIQLLLKTVLFEQSIKEPQISSIQSFIETELSTLTTPQRFELLHDISLLKDIFYRVDAAHQQLFDSFVKKISGLNKETYIQERSHPNRPYYHNIHTAQLTAGALYNISRYYREKKGIKIYVEQHLDDINVVPLTGEFEQHIKMDIQAYSEIMSIQQTLEEGEYAGYLFNNIGRMERGFQETHRSHVQPFIIGKNEIIAPVIWNSDHFGSLFHENSEYNYSDNFSIGGFFMSKTPIQPQAGMVECGALSFAYLKNLLENEAYQLRELCLRVPAYTPFYNDEVVLIYKFFASPDVLRYSQSSTYNKAIKQMLLDEESTIKHDNQDISIQSLKNELLNTIKIATDKGDDRIKAQAELMLAQLPAFKMRWEARYELITKKRAQLQGEDYNEYLSYTLTRMNRIAEGVKQDASNPGLEVLKQFDKMINSKAQPNIIIDFLKINIALVPFESPLQISYFLFKVGHDFYVPLLPFVKNYFIDKIKAFDDLFIFLTPIQQNALIDYIHDVINQKGDFSHIFSNEETVTSFITIYPHHNQNTAGDVLAEILPNLASAVGQSAVDSIDQSEPNLLDNAVTKPAITQSDARETGAGILSAALEHTFYASKKPSLEKSSSDIAPSADVTTRH